MDIPLARSPLHSSPGIRGVSVDRDWALRKKQPYALQMLKFFLQSNRHSSIPAKTRKHIVRIT